MSDLAMQLPLEWPDTHGVLDMEADRELIRQMDLLKFDCGNNREFHAPHPIQRDGTTDRCPGLTSQYCGKAGDIHPHHRWAKPGEFFWCNGTRRLHDSTGRRRG